MKLILSLTLIWAFCSTAGAIRCHRCVDVNDLDCRFDRVEECRADEICLNAFITETDGTQRIYRDCASPDVCPSVGPLNISSNLGGIIAVANATCCDTDECNVATLGYPALPEVNGIQCPGCDAGIDNCDPVVSCRGEEDSCFQANILKDRVLISVSGCGTSNVCDISDDIEHLPFMEEVGTILNTTCYLFTTTTTAPPTTTTTTPEPTTTTTPEPTTTTTPEPTTTSVVPSTDDVISSAAPTVSDAPPTGSGSTTVFVPSPEFFAKVKPLLQALYQLSVAMKIQMAQQQHAVLFQLHQHLINYQQQLLLQQQGLPIGHGDHLPLYYQQCLLVNHHQLLLQQIHLSLCGQQNLLQLFSKQQLVLHKLQELLHGQNFHLLPHYYKYLANGCTSH
ncbi:unnamed protein product [Ophioblennius macclurei]